MNESFVKYINAGPLDKEWGLYLTVAGYAQIPPSLLYPPRVHPSGYFFTWEKGWVLQEYQILLWMCHLGLNKLLPFLQIKKSVENKK